MVKFDKDLVIVGVVSAFTTVLLMVILEVLLK